jgi:hypothetical protein
MTVQEYPQEFADEDEDLTDFERLKVAAIYQILKTGKAVINTDDYRTVIDYTDR